MAIREIGHDAETVRRHASTGAWHLKAGGYGGYRAWHHRCEEVQYFPTF